MSTKAPSKIYYDHNNPGFISEVERFLKRARQLYVPGTTQEAVQEYLRREQAYTLHKPASRRLTRNHIYVVEINTQLQADLADIKGIARQNGEMRNFFTVIDVFSKFA